MATLANTDVFPLALGTNSFGWTSDEAGSHAVLDAFVDGGGNVLDTSNSYGAGTSESFIGSWLARTGRREEVFVMSKVGRHPDRIGLRAETIRHAVDEQLARLRTDRLDMLWAHFDDPDTPLAETVGALDQAVRAGKARAIGISNYEPDRIAEWFDIVEEHGYAPPVALQPEYSLIRRHSYEDQRQAIALDHHLAVLPYWGLASGVLTGKYASAEDAAGTPRERLVAKYADQGAFRVVDVLREVAAAHRVEPGTVALAWLLTRPGITAPIASVSRPEQLPALLAVPALELADEEVARLTAASDATGG